LQKPTRALSLALLTSIVALAAAAPGANAGVLVESAPDCDQVLEQPFTRWGDDANYTLAPNGGFENGADSWKLSGGAETVSGNEPWYVRSADDSHSLHLPRRSSAKSGTVCVGLEHPTMRFFARSRTSGLTGALLSSLRVDVLTETSLGLVVSVPIALITPRSSWRPSHRVLILANLLPLLPGEHTPVAFRFTAQGPGEWWIDDVYVDPRGRR
jgi:hypothetical protein